jgi:Domain of Unknown Function (DUF350).
MCVLLVDMEGLNLVYLLHALAYAASGIALFAGALALLSRAVPVPFWKAIVEEQNMALAVVAGFVALSVAVIVASAVH